MTTQRVSSRRIIVALVSTGVLGAAGFGALSLSHAQASGCCTGLAG